MARISLIDEMLDEQNNGWNIILSDAYLKNCLILTIFFMFQYSGSWKK